MARQAFHGGTFFSAIGEDFSTLEKSQTVINADVLDAWFDPSPRVVKKIKAFLPFLARTSPPTHCEGLIRTISNVQGVPTNQIMVGGGSSNLMFTFFPHMLNHESVILILDPMYGEYQHIFTHVVGSHLRRHLLTKKDDFIIHFDHLINEIKAIHPSMVALVNPNSPTGVYWDRENALALLQQIPKDILLVIDETYIDYINKSYSLEKEITRFSNLIIIKSMSKVYALSGLRVGYMVANKQIVDKISLYNPPWSVNMLGQLAGIEALQDEDYYKQKYAETHQLREETIASFKKNVNIRVYNSVANFFLVELLNNKFSADDIYKKLVKKNIYIRNCDSMSIQFKNSFLRIAVKNSKNNKIISDAFNALFI